MIAIGAVALSFPAGHRGGGFAASSGLDGPDRIA
jgi:hypothetical protein